MKDIRENRANGRFLPGICLDPAVVANDSAVECVSDADLIMICVPSAFVRETLEPLLPAFQKGAILLNVAKGFAPGTRTPLPFMLEKLAPRHSCVHLAGPAIANEFARGQTAFVMMASSSEPAARRVAERFSGPTFAADVTTDVTGAALGGALKNVYAILLGALERLSGNSRNLEGAAVTACVHEMADIATAHGGRRATLFGLAGLGDLVATGFSPDSHNRRFGQMLASGKPVEAIKGEIGWLPEGVRATAAACSLADEKKLPAPLAGWVQRSLAGEPPSLDGLMAALHRTSSA